MNWDEEVLARKEAMLRDLKALLRIPSFKGPAEDGKPMGAAIAEALEFMLRLAEQEQLVTKNVEGYAGYAEYRSESCISDDHIGVLCHLDVVPAATGAWTSPPFEPEIRDGKLYARGAIDDKGPTIAAFNALKIVKELGLPLKHKVRIIFGTDEESGMRCMDRYNELEQMPIAGFAPDAEFPITHAEKGQINGRVMLTEDQSNANQDQHDLQLISFYAGEAANMVPETAEATFTGRKPLLDEIRRQFIQYCESIQQPGQITGEADDQITLHLKGKSAHGMEPELGVNAGLLLIHFLKDYSFQPDAQNYISCIDTCLYDDYLGAGLGIQAEDDITGKLTVNVGLLRYSLQEPSYFHLNIRFPGVTDHVQAVESIQASVGKFGLMMETPTIKNPHHVHKDHPMIRALQTIYEEETSLEPTLLTTGGGTYASRLDNGVAFGAQFPGTESTAHQVDEYIEIDHLLKATTIYARAIYTLANLDYGDS